MLCPAISPEIDEMLTIEPGWFSRISGSACFEPRNTLSAFTAMPRRHSARLKSSIDPRIATPALFTSTDRLPIVSRAQAIAAIQSSSLETSWRIECATPAPNSASIASATCRAPTSLTSVSRTLAPSRASPQALAAPRPCAAPVISAFFPSTLRLIAFSSAERRSLQRHQRRDPAAGQREQFQELRLAERRAFGRALHLDQSARPGPHEIRVGLGGRILGVVEIEQRFALDDPAGDSGDVILQRALAQDRAGRHPFQAIAERDAGAGDGGGPRAAVRLQHVAIDRDLTLAQLRQIDDGAQRTADQALNLLGAAGDLAGGRLAPRARRGRARQHCIFRGHPAPPLPAQPRRRLVFERGGAENMRVAEAHQARPLRIASDGALDGDFAQLIGRALGRAHGEVLSSAGRSRPARGACPRACIPLPASRVLAVIASVAKQSISPRAGPPTIPKKGCVVTSREPAAAADEAGLNRRAANSGTVGCFASLAMTVFLQSGTGTV